MLLLWLSFVILSAVVLLALLRPMLRHSEQGQTDSNAADRAIYRDQLAEVAADRARGLIGSAEADAAEREIARRLIAHADTRAASDISAALPPSRDYTVLAGALALMPLAAIGLYHLLGSPSLPSRPFDPRAVAEMRQVDALVARVEARLREHPDDGQGWDVIAPIYLRQQRYREAADAFANANRILGSSPKRLSGFAEATIVANNGIVTEPAKSAYTKVLELDPGRIEARFWLAMAKEQDGVLDAAAADYRALLAEAPKDAPWRQAVSERLEILAPRLGTPREVSKEAERGRGAAPDADAAVALQNLTPEERAKAIAGMVDGLAARLKQDGGDLQGWLRLVRAYKVLGRDQAAVGALSDARRAMQGNTAALFELDALAKSLGIGS